MQKSTLFILIFIATVCSNAQTTVAREGLQPGLRALQFGINTRFQPEPLYGGLISYKKMKSATRGVYTGVSYGFSANNVESSSENLSDDDFSQFPKRQEDDERAEFSVRLERGRIRYFQSKTDVLPFVTMGFYTGLDLNDRAGQLTEQTVYTYSDGYVLQTVRTNTNKLDSRRVQLRAGWSGGAGVQYFIARNISLQAVYQATIDFYGSSTTNKNSFVSRTDTFVDGQKTGTSTSTPQNQKTKTRDAGFGLGQRGVRFSVSAYF